MKNIILIVCLFVCSQIVNAQVNVKFNPIGEKLKDIGMYKKSPSFIPPAKILPKFNLDSILYEDTKRMDLGLPFRYGYEFNVQYSPFNSGKWDVKDSMAIWKLKVNSTNAFSLSFHFNRFYLPEKTNLIIYNEEESFLYGPLTSNQNNEKNKFTTGPVQGESVILELVVPVKLKDKVQIEIGRVIHGYVNILPTSSTSSASLNCHNNVACYQAWDEESDAVAKLIMGTGLCSGSLQNNTENDYRAFLLTAFHCVDTDNDGDYDGNDYDVDDYVFHFQYKSSLCAGSYASYVEYNSASYRAGWSDSDFALLELDDSPIGNGDITWLGWDNRANTPTSGTCIHHPQGDIMKISFDNNALTTNNQILYWSGGSPSPVSTHWDVGFDNGTTENGSSGSPLFDQNNRVVGQLHGGDTGCPPVTKYFGRFDVSWDGGGTNATQLAHWLDPNDTGNPTTDLLRSPGLTVPDVICYSGTTVSMQNPPSGVTVTWGGTNVAYPYGNTGTSVTVRAASSSTSNTGTVTASFTVNERDYSISHPVWVGKPAFTGLIHGDIFIPLGTVEQYWVDASEIQLQQLTVYDWDVTSNLDMVSSHYYQQDVFVEGIATGRGSVFFIATNGCGTSQSSLPVRVTDMLLLSITPNPTNGETIITIESSSEETTFDETAPWELEIYSEMQLLKTKQTGLRGQNARIQTVGWKEGVYLVRVNYKDKILIGKLVVKK